MAKLTHQQEVRLLSRAKHWNKALERLHSKNITKGSKYTNIFFMCQALDCVERYAHIGRFDDPCWEKLNSTLPQKHRQKARLHQKKLVERAQVILNDL